MDFFNQTILETEAVLQTDLEHGLTEEEAKRRLKSYGENSLKEKKRKSWLKIFLGELNNPMIYVLFAATLVTLCVSIYETIVTIRANLPVDFLSTGDWPDVIIIIAVILLNAGIGTIQEVKAETSLEALKKLASPEVTVLRDQMRQKIKASLLVPGDIVILEEGDTIGADLRLVESMNLKINESSLTGEAESSLKDCHFVCKEKVGIGDRKNCAYMSTVVTYGRGMGIVTHTGMQTQIGKIADGIDQARVEATPLQRVLAKLSKVLGIFTLGIVMVVLFVDLLWVFLDGSGIKLERILESFLTSISLAVAAIPEGLPAVVTIVLSLGVQRMVKANTIVRKLPSVESLGAVQIICSDKTGTLTQNKMKVVEAYTLGRTISKEEFQQEKKSLKPLAVGLSLCSNATIDEGLYGDPTELALVLFANELDFHKKDLELLYPRIEEIPFDSNRKMMSTYHMHNQDYILYTKGALDHILLHVTRIVDKKEIRPITAEDKRCILQANQVFSEKALRVLALAYKESPTMTEEDLVFLGLVAMIDPPRLEAKPAVEKFKSAGIKTVMITGDHKQTAYAIANTLGICDDIKDCYTGNEIDEMDKEELREVCKSACVFARVSPENKVSVVQAYKSLGYVVAMTGDGVNDAPSLKTADIGIAMGLTGTDVAKSAADMILTDDNFASIEKAVEEGRSIYANIRRAVFFLLGSNIAEVFTLFILICIGLPTPLIAIHLLWVNLVTDSLPAIALGMQPKDKDIMNQPPRDSKEGIFARGGFGLTIGYGIIITIAVILAFLSCGWIHGSFRLDQIKSLYLTHPSILIQAQTMAFTTLAFCELFHMLGMSNLKHSVITIFKNKNWMLSIAFFLGIVLQLFVVETPKVQDVFSASSLSWQLWIIVLGLSILPLLVHEIIIFLKKN